MRTISNCAILLAMCSASLAQEATDQRLLNQSEPAIQSQIEAIFQLLQQSGISPENNVEAFREIQALKDMVADKGEIVKQVAIFSASPGEQQPLAALAILNLLDLPPSIVIRTLAPYLNADSSNLRSFVKDWFQGHDNAGKGESPLTPVNYEDYEKYVRGLINARRDIPVAFVEYIYERSPDRALFVFYNATKRERGSDRTIVLAAHIVGDSHWFRSNGFDEQFQKLLPTAKSELVKLAKHDEWWVRLYTAEIMRRHRELRQNDVVEALSKDINPIVAKTAISGRQ